MLLTQVITDVAGTVFVLHDHFVAAFPAIHNPMEERFAIAGHAARFVPIVFGVIVAQRRLDFLKGLPVHVGRIFVFHDDSPLHDFMSTLEAVYPPAVGTACLFGQVGFHLSADHGLLTGLEKRPCLIELQSEGL